MCLIEGDTGFMQRTILWCSGWGINPVHLRKLAKFHLPEFRHEVIIPNQHFFSEAERINIKGVDAIVAYSLGGALILNNYEHWSLKGNQTFFVAPFFDIKREAELGGCLSVGHLKYLRKLLLKNPVHAINDFYQRVGLKFRIEDGVLPYAKEDLLWGIDYLSENRACSNLLMNCRSSVVAVFGEKDVLVDNHVMQSYFSDFYVVPGATHCIDTMFAFIKNQTR